MKSVLSAAVILFALCFHGPSFAQITWRKAYGAFANDNCKAVLVIHDDLILAGGSTGSFGAGSSDIYLVAVDGMGTFLWSKTIGGQYLEQLAAMNTCSNGDVIISGSYFGEASTGYEGLLVRMDQEGEVLWQRTYGGIDWDFFHDVKELPDGGFAVAGETFSFGEPGSNAWVLRLNSDGDTLWTRTFGVPGGQVAYSLENTLDEGFVVAGGITNAAGDDNAWVLKLDASGGTQWSREYGGSGDDIAYDVIATMEGGYSFVGSTGSYSDRLRSYHVKLDGMGNVQWSKNWGGSDDQESFDHLELISAEYLLTGYVRLPGGGGKDMYLQKSWVDGEFVFGVSYGGLNDDAAYSLDRISEGYIVAGTTSSYGSGMTDMFIVRTGLDGLTASQNVDSDFDALSIHDDEEMEFGLRLHPNPSSGHFRITGMEPVSACVFDMRGQIMAVLDVPAVGEDLHTDLTAGSYVLEATDREGVLRRGRLLIVHP